MVTFVTAFIMFKLIDLAIGLRVSPEEEVKGLDSAEHGGNAYPDFGISSHGGIESVSGSTGEKYSEIPGMTKSMIKPVTQW